MAADTTYASTLQRRHTGDAAVPTGKTLEIESGGALIRAPGSKSTVGSSIKSATPYTVLASESGTVFIADVADCVFNLPATVLGLIYTFVTKTLSATTGLSVSPVAADKINAKADDADLINSAATDAVGDSVTIVADGVDGWYTIAKVGTWA